jgi:hypothetical protein
MSQVSEAEHRALLTATQVARPFGVDPQTVTRWANEGRLRTVPTPGGHRRYIEDEVLRCSNQALQRRMRIPNDDSEDSQVGSDSQGQSTAR